MGSSRALKKNSFITPESLFRLLFLKPEVSPRIAHALTESFCSKFHGRFSEQVRDHSALTDDLNWETFSATEMLDRKLSVGKPNLSGMIACSGLLRLVFWVANPKSIFPFSRVFLGLHLTTSKSSIPSCWMPKVARFVAHVFSNCFRKYSNFLYYLPTRQYSLSGCPIMSRLILNLTEPPSVSVREPLSHYLVGSCCPSVTILLLVALWAPIRRSFDN